MHEIKNKLASSKGESLAEVLVASLIAALAMLLLATMVMNAGNIVSKSEKSMNKFYKGITTVDSRASSGGDNKSVKIKVESENKTKGSKMNAEISATQYTDTDSGLTAYETAATP